MENAIAFVSKPGYKWTYLVIFSIATGIYSLVCAMGEEKIQAMVSILTALLDWVGILGFVRRRPHFDFPFWRGWFWWSLFWFFTMGAGRELLGQLAFDATSLFFLAIAGIYYTTFFIMLYAYAYVEEEIWR